MKTSLIKSCILLLLLGLFQPLNAVPIHIKIVFPHFTPSEVGIGGSFNEWCFIPMNRLADRVYEYHDDVALGYHQMNIQYKVPTLITNRYVYASTATEGYPRIPYTKIYINNQLVSSTFVRSNYNINFHLTNEGIITPLESIDPGNPVFDDRIPPEVDHPKDSINVPNGVPGSQYNKVAGWVQVLHDNNFMGSSKVEVKSIKLYARVGSESVILDSAEYSVTPFDPVNNGGLYFRYPFFVQPTAHSPMYSASVVNGMLTFHPSDYKDSVWHFWNPAIPLVPTSPDYTSYWFEIVYRITGQACIQVGIDFRDGADNTLEGAVSKWKFETFGQQFDTLRVDTRKVVTSVNHFEKKEDVPRFTLYDSHPNPSNSVFLIRYAVPVREHVNIKLYDTSGQEVFQLIDHEQEPGQYKLELNGAHYSSGIYYLRIVSGHFSATQKLILIK